MKALITGSRGVLGQSLASHLAVANVDAVGVDVTGNSSVRCDVRDTVRLTGLASGCDVMIHAAAALPSYATDDIWSIDVEGTRSALNAAASAGVSRFVHISSTAVYGLPDIVPTPESHPRLGVDAYSKAKGQAERECEQLAERFAQLTIVRPKTFLGPGRLGLFSMLFEWAHEGRDFPVIGDGSQRTQMLDVDDLCEVLMTIINGDVPQGLRTYNLGATRFGGIGDDFQAVLDAAGHGGKIRHLPLTPAVHLLRAAAAIGRSPVYPRLISKLRDDSFVDTTLAENELGFTPRYSNQESLIRTYQWWLATANQQSIAGNAHTAPWAQGVLRFAKPFLG